MLIEQIQVGTMAVFCYLVYDEKTNKGILVDPGADPGVIFDKIRMHGLSVEYIVNTHGHADHTAGNFHIKKATDAKILIHADDGRYLRSPGNRIFSRLLGGRISPVPDAYIKEGDIISCGSLELLVMETPGHTPGGITLYSNGNLFTGDTLFTEGTGRTDLKGGSEEALLHSIREKILRYPPETVIWPGHNYGRFPVTTVAEQTLLYC